MQRNKDNNNQTKMNLKKAKTWGEVTKIFSSIYNLSRTHAKIKKDDKRKRDKEARRNL